MAGRTYSPYEARAKAEERAREMMRRMNLPEGWHADIKRALTTLAHEGHGELADALLRRISQLHTAHNERGKFIEEYLKEEPPA